MAEGLLIFEDGTVVKAEIAGSRKDVFGEIVFNTSMTGYAESFTDPSYAGQILLMTYPLIGNYGIHRAHFESARVHIRGLVLKEPSFFSHRGIHFQKFLEQARIPCLYGVDTRALTVKIRRHGTMKAMLVAHNDKKTNPVAILKKMRRMPHPDTENLVAHVSCKNIIEHKNRTKKRIVLIDCGVKNSILNHLRRYANVFQVPYDTDCSAIQEINPHAIVISNGPGNPSHPDIIKTTVTTVHELIGCFPVLGICIGHQILGIALGFDTYKLTFGHRGSNHAVKSLSTKRVYITSQNHGYALKPRNIKGVVVEWSNVNDGTIEGLRHTGLPVSSVQFHPEASPGPHDTSFLFTQFIEATYAQA